MQQKLASGIRHLDTFRGGLGQFCSPLKSPHQPWPFPAATAEMEKLKPGQGSQDSEATGRVQHPGVSPGPSRQPCRELPVKETRARTWDLSASLEASQAMREDLQKGERAGFS